MRTIHSRIKYLRDRKGLTQEELGDILNVTGVAVSRWELGITSPRQKTLLKLADYFDVSLNWLQTGAQKNEKIKATISIPFYPHIEASAGVGCFPYENEPSDYITIFKDFLTGVSSLANVVCISVTGDSMYPIIRDNGIVAVDLGNRIIKDGNIYLFCHNDMLRIKKLYQLPTGLKVESQNQDYKDEFYSHKEISSDNFMILGKVVWYSSSL